MQAEAKEKGGLRAAFLLPGECRQYSIITLMALCSAAASKTL